LTAKTLKLMVFAHLGQNWNPCGQLLMTEENTEVLASSFAWAHLSLVGCDF
jgi:serine/threonine-protein kinase HipA